MTATEAPATAATATAVAKVTRMLGISIAMRRVMTSRTAPRNVAAMATTENQLKASPDGWTIIRTPTRPTMIALQRRQATFSPRKRIASTVTISGLERLIAEIFGSGKWKSAQR